MTLDHIPGGHPASRQTFNEALKTWRNRRRRSQLALALDADISQRHLSFLETGRSLPSRDMVLRLARCLDLPLRQENSLLASAGFAPLAQERPLEDPAFASARQAIGDLLRSHEPFPALVINARWNMLMANQPLKTLLAEVDDQKLLKPPVNVIRLALHPKGLAPRILNFGEWRSHLLGRLERHIAATGDEALVALLEEVRAYPLRGAQASAPSQDLITVLRLRTELGTLSLFTTTTVFGAPHDVTLSEVAIESFFPADADTRQILQAMPAGG